MLHDNFDYVANAEGYTVYYKGKPLGGASILGKSKARGKVRCANIKEYVASAERDILALINGNGYKHMREAIAAIDKANEPYPQPVISSMG